MHTYRFRSSFRASGLTPTKLRSMRDMRSSRNKTISWLKNFSRHGLLAMWTLGILDRSRAESEARSGLRGRTALTVRSEGPGTKTKCVRCVRRVYDAMRSARESNPSAREVKYKRSCVEHQKKWASKEGGKKVGTRGDY
jgi:hypothetical protein